MAYVPMLSHLFIFVLMSLDLLGNRPRLNAFFSTSPQAAVHGSYLACPETKLLFKGIPVRASGTFTRVVAVSHV